MRGWLSVPTRQIMDRTHSAVSRTAVLLVNPSGLPIYANRRALAILAYPGVLSTWRKRAGFSVGSDLGYGSRNTRHRVPLGERSGAEHAVMSSPQEMAPDPEEILHNAVDRGEPLEMSDRLEAAHLAFTLSGAFM